MGVEFVVWDLGTRSGFNIQSSENLESIVQFGSDVDLHRQIQNHTDNDPDSDPEQNPVSRIQNPDSRS